MNNIIIIGKNSTIVRSLGLNNITTISHADNFFCCKGKVVVVFSVDKKNSTNNIKMFQEIRANCPRSIVLISSVSVLVRENNFYPYVRMKALQEELLQSMDLEFEILRLTTPNWLKGSERHPNLLFNKESLKAYLTNLNNRPLSNDIIYLVDETKSISFLGKIYCFLYNNLPVWVMRIFDIFMKYFTYTSYGYSMQSYLRYINMN